MFKVVVVAVALVIAAPHRAHADGFGLLRFTAGGVLPVTDATWRHSAQISPKVSAGVGGIYRAVGLMFTADVTAVRVGDDQDLFAIGASNEKFRRVRLLGNVLYERRGIGHPNATLSARLGAGADIAYTSYDRYVGGTNFPKSLTKSGVAFELAAAGWLYLGPGVEVGAELAVPISYHASETAPAGKAGFTYTSLDLDIMIGARFTSRD